MPLDACCFSLYPEKLKRVPKVQPVFSFVRTIQMESMFGIEKTVWQGVIQFGHSFNKPPKPEKLPPVHALQVKESKSWSVPAVVIPDKDVCSVKIPVVEAAPVHMASEVGDFLHKDRFSLFTLGSLEKLGSILDDVLQRDKRIKGFGDQERFPAEESSISFPSSDRSDCRNSVFSEITYVFELTASLRGPLSENETKYQLTEAETRHIVMLEVETSFFPLCTYVNPRYRSFPGLLNDVTRCVMIYRPEIRQTTRFENIQVVPVDYQVSQPQTTYRRSKGFCHIALLSRTLSNRDMSWVI